MIFKGVGEYRCEDCKAVEFDDYGKVRNFIEHNKGSNAAQIEAETGVSQRSIRQMLKEDRLEVSQDSKAFIKCEFCGAVLRSGRFCPKCEATYHKQIEEEKRKQKHLHSQLQGLGKSQGETGAKRFTRE